MAISMVSRAWRGLRAVPAVATKPYLNVGCGPHPRGEFVNLDYMWRPGVDVCWDIRRALPFPDARFDGIYSEHCLEHISQDDCGALLREFRRVLRPGGRARIVVPDAELFLRVYVRRLAGEDVRFPYEPRDDGTSSRRATPMEHVNRIFRSHDHRFAYDFETLAAMLRQAGFRSVERAALGRGGDPRLLIDQDWREVESLYVEASP